MNTKICDARLNHGSGSDHFSQVVTQETVLYTNTDIYIYISNHIYLYVCGVIYTIIILKLSFSGETVLGIKHRILYIPTMEPSQLYLNAE